MTLARSLCVRANFIWFYRDLRSLDKPGSVDPNAMNQRHETQTTFAAEPEANTLSSQTLPLEEYLPETPAESKVGVESAGARMPGSSLRSARLVAISGRRATIVWRGHADRIDADISPDVDLELLTLAQRNGDAVFVEVDDHDKLLVVGVMQTRLSREVRITADKILLDAAQEVVVRAGRAAIRLREDGDVELVGSRISAASRGLFRLVGRILRLN